MVAFRSGPRPSGKSLKKINESRKSKIEKAFKEDNMEMAPGGPKKTIQPNPKKEKGLMKLPNKFDPKGKKITGERKPIELKKSGGRIGLKGGGISQRGLGRAFMKGGRV